MRLVAALLLALALLAPEARGEPRLAFPALAREELGFPGYEQVAKEAASSYARVRILGEIAHDRGRPRQGVVAGASGIVLEGGFVLTAAHIARDARFEAEVTTADGRTLAGSVVALAPEHDLALIRVEDGADLEPARLASGSMLTPGAPVLAIGSPRQQLGVVAPGRMLEPRMESGVHYADPRYGAEEAMALTLSVMPGFSGGPVLDEEGRVIGMITGFRLDFGDDLAIAYAVPVERFRPFLEEARTGAAATTLPSAPASEGPSPRMGP